MTRLLTTACATLLATLTFHSTAQSAEPDPISYRADGAQPVITFSRLHGMVRGVSDLPLLYVYADGRVHVDLPVYMKNAGRYEYRLGRAELDALIRNLDTQGVTQFDAAAVRKKRDDALRSIRVSTGQRFATLDSTVTRIELNFAGFARSDAPAAPLRRTVEWADVAIDAQRLPQITEIVTLAAAEKSLLALIDHPRRKPVESQRGEQQ